MPTLIQHSQSVTPSLTTTESALHAHSKPELVSALPTTTDTPQAALSMTETHTVQQLALLLGRRGLERAAKAMQQHQSTAQHGSAYSRLSTELLSSISWLPSWSKQHSSLSSKQANQHAPATAHPRYAGDMYDAPEQEEAAMAHQQAMAGQGSKLDARAVKLYATHIPSFEPGKSVELSCYAIAMLTPSKVHVCLDFTLRHLTVCTLQLIQ